MDRRVRTPLWLALACVVLFAALVAAAYGWERAAALDLLGLTGFISANSGWLAGVTGRLVQLGDPPEVALITLALVALALARGRPRVALGVLALVGATSVSSQVLKLALAHTREVPILDGALGPEAFPSGHATAAMTLALAAVLVAPRSARPAAALLGALVALAVGGSTMALAWHFPSDVLGGYLLATAWTLLLVAGLRAAERRFPAGDRWGATVVARATQRVAARGLPVAAGAGVLAALLAGLVVVAADPQAAAEFGRTHTTAVAIAGAVAAAALALPAVVTALVGQGRRDA